MVESTEKKEMENTFRIARIIWMAMLASLVVYLVLCHLLGEQVRKGMETGFPVALLRNVLLVVAAVELGLIHFLRKLMLTVRPGTARNTPRETVSGAQPSYVSKYLSAVMVSLALADCIGIYGLILFFLGADLETFYTFIGLSAVAMFFYRPKMDELLQLATAMAPDPGVRQPESW